MIQPVDLTAHPSITRLVALLPESRNRDDLAATYRRRTEQLREVLDYGATLAGRIQEISELLPDTPQDKKGPLLTERMRLQSEQLAMPADLRVSARLYVEALQDWSSHTYSCAHSELRKGGAKLNETNQEFERVSRQLQRVHPSDDRYVGYVADFQKLEKARRPTLERQDAMKQLQELIDEHVGRVLRENTNHHIKVRNGRALNDQTTVFADRVATERAA